LFEGMLIEPSAGRYRACSARWILRAPHRAREPRRKTLQPSEKSSAPGACRAGDFDGLDVTALLAAERMQLGQADDTRINRNAFQRRLGTGGTWLQWHS
jgi:hypothetical protein